MFNEICIYEVKLDKQDEVEELMKEVAAFYMEQQGAYFGDIRTLIPGTSGQHIGIIRTAYREHPDTLSS